MISTHDESHHAYIKSKQVVLSSHTVQWPQKSKLAFLRRAAGLPRLYWETEQDPVGFAGFGIAVAFSSSGEARFEEIDQQIKRLLGRWEQFGEDFPGSQPRFFGGFSFGHYTAFHPDAYGILKVIAGWRF